MFVDLDVTCTVFKEKMMQILCPNCKRSADIVTIDGVDYIECPECGWFKVEDDGSMSVCDGPPKENTLSDPASTATGGDEPVPDPQPEPAVPAASSPGQPGIEDEDIEDEDDEIKVVVTFED